MHYHTVNTARTQQRFIRSQMASTDCLSAFSLLTSELLFDEIEKRLPDHRERLFPPTETLAMFVAQAMSTDRSCQHAVNEAAIHRLVNGLPRCSTHTGGYCRARQRLPLKLVSGLTCYLGQQVDQQLPTEWRWHRRRVRLVCLGGAVSGIVLVGDAVGVAGGVVAIVPGLDDLDEVVMTVIGVADGSFGVVGA